MILTYLAKTCAVRPTLARVAADPRCQDREHRLHQPPPGGRQQQTLELVFGRAPKAKSNTFDHFLRLLPYPLTAENCAVAIEVLVETNVEASKTTTFQGVSEPQKLP